ncbi:MAG: dehypoxanthine futalosine cyclase [Candidatus Omnitrophica bacterium]|nr:dehypoxanthine futalosine cyclase [Candidatus Omnitrophota bacterium]
MGRVEAALQKAYDGKRLDREEALSLYEAHLLELGMVADHCRKRFHPEEIITFVIDRNINYTNVCVTYCKFCAFYRPPNASEGAWFYTNEEIFQKIQELVEMGGTQVLLQGGHHPKITLEYYTDLLREIKKRFKVHIHSFSAPEIEHLSRVSRKPIREVLVALKEAGLNSVPGGGAEILVDRVKEAISPLKTSSEKWMEIHETIHSLGIRSTATMMFGTVETQEERLIHLEKVRSLQDKTGGFTAFIPWSFCPDHTELENEVEAASGEEYLRTLAISRIYLDNISNIPTGWVTEGYKVGQLGLFFGANDFGGILMEEKVIAATGVAYQMAVDQAVSLIRKAGKIPAQRNTMYEVLRTFE